MDELNRLGRLSMPEIVEKFSISESTARRLCIDLERDQKAVRILGGIQKVVSATNNEYSYDIRTTQNVGEKQRIGRRAAELVESGDVIYITGGTTVHQLVLRLKERIDEGQLHGVVIMTNSLSNAETLGSVTRVMLTGGEFRPHRRDLAGFISEKNIRSAHFSKSFIGVDGMDLVDGLMALDIDTANMDHLVAEQSEKSYILADHTKFEKQSFVVFQRFLSSHTVITDSGVDERYRRLAQESGVNMIVV